MIGWLAVALAAPHVDAEGVRLGEELRALAASNNWIGVERKYGELLRNHPRSLDGGSHLLGAQAAQSRGDLMLAAQRWQRVPPADPAHPQANAELERVARGARLVALENPDRLPLTRAELPFDPGSRVAIERAAMAVERDGLFVGLLPMGTYELGDTTLQVGSGFDWQVLP